LKVPLPPGPPNNDGIITPAPALAPPPPGPGEGTGLPP